MMFCRKKILLFIFCFCIAHTKLFSQSNIGLIVGPQFSNYSKPLNIPQIQNSDTYKNSTFVGFLLGMNFRKSLENQDYLQFGLLYSMRGDRYVYKTRTLDGYNVLNLFNESGAYLNYFFDYRSHYIEIPLLYSWNLIKRSQKKSLVNFYLSSGFSLGLNVVSKTSYNSFELTSRGSLISGIDENYHEEKFDRNNPILLNYLADFEIEFNLGKVSKFFMSGRYSHSLTKVYKNEYDDLNTRVSTIGYTLGIRRYLKRAESTTE